MRRKSVYAVLAAAGVIVPGMLLLAGCPPEGSLDAIGLRPGNAGFSNRVLGATRLVALEQGNLAQASASSAQERIDVLADFLSQYSSEFGLSSAKAGEIEFLPAVPEFEAGMASSGQHQTVALHQSHQGALILDAVQYGDFVLNPAGGQGQLRRVFGRLFDPGSLPAPPIPTREMIDAATRGFTEFLVEQGREEGSVSILETPVILAEESIAGFLALRTELPEEVPDTAQGRLAAIVDPEGGVLKVIYDIDACHAGAGLGGAL